MFFLLNSLNERAARLTTAAVIGIAMMYGCAAVAEEHDHEDLRAEIQDVRELVDGVAEHARTIAGLQQDTMLNLEKADVLLKSLIDETQSQHESRLFIIDERLSRHERHLSLLNEALSVGTDTRSTHQEHLSINSERLSLLGETLDMLIDRVERLEAERGQ